MIVSDIATSLRLYDDYSAVADFASFPPDVADLCRNLSETIADLGFPGALVPVVASASDLYVIALASTNAEWRRVNPILVAFAGPTLTSFAGLPEDIPGTDAISKLVRSTNPAVTGILRLPSEAKAQLAGLRAMARARDTLQRAPALQRASPEPTSWLLASFQDNLNVGRRGAANTILGRLRKELRVDALNLKFIEVQLLGNFEDWQAIVELSGFAKLCIARRPPAITALLLEALYQTQLRAPFEAKDKEEVQSRYVERVRPLATSMLTLPVPATMRPGGWRLFGMEAYLAPSRSDIRVAINAHRSTLGWIAEQLSGAEFTEPGASVNPVVPLDAARSALAETETIDSLDTLAAAIASIERLSPNDLARLREAEPFRSLLQVVNEAQIAGGVPTNWREWLTRIADPSFTDALNVARQGSGEWSIDADSADPIVIRSFVASLEASQADKLASERATQALPFMVAWLYRDPEFPRGAFAPVYATLLTLFAMNVVRGRPIYESSQILIHALLATGLDQKAYRSLIDDTDELAGSGFGVEMVYWLLEIIEDLLRFGSPDTSARETFLHSALARIAPIQGRLTSLQRAAVVRLAQELGWQPGSFGLADTLPTADDLTIRLANLKIAIYTLTESSSRQAKVAIEETVPSTTVDCNSDHVGTARLRALAENADLFVMTSLSAKHAATDFIREHRGNRPLLYAHGRGVSSILRAIEEHVLAKCMT